MMKAVSRKLGIASLVLFICLSVFSVLNAQNLGFINDQITTTSYIIGEEKHLRFNIQNPNAVQANDNEFCIWPVVDADITVSNITVTLDAITNEILGDLKYADTFIGLASPIVINDFDTTSGVRVDSSISSASVAVGKAIYISFDSAPNVAITQACFDITYSYD